MPDLDMLINHVHGEESRVAIVEDGKLEELYTERVSADLHVGNIYRGKVINVEPSIQAAFIEFGETRAGFLHISDLHPRYFPGESYESTEKVGEKTPRRERPPIQRALRRGQEILVQVLKEGLGNKGPTLTSYLSIPGRYLVMMPYMERHGVSRKVEDPDKRREMRRILDDLDPPQDFGFIVRTAGIGRNKTELKRDLNYLLRLWKNIAVKMKSGRGPALLYTESDLVIRTLRDVLTTEIKRVIIDDRAAALRAREFLRIATPRGSTKVIHYSQGVPLFDAFDIERQIQVISQRVVPMPNGGSLVFDQTEALVAIDVNSGKFRDSADAEENAYRTNLDAVEEIARQLRLRDLGGLLVLDLIDMYVHRHRREVERRFKEAIKRDRARTKLERISELGLLEMTRQRMRPSLRKSVYNECPTCHGVGHVLSPQSVMLEVMRRLAVVLNAEKVVRVELTAHPEVLAQLLNRKRIALVELENTSGKRIEFNFNAAFGPDQVDLTCFDGRDAVVNLESLAKPHKPKFTEADEVSAQDLAELDDLGQEEELIETPEAEEAEAEEAVAVKKPAAARREKEEAAEPREQDQPEEAGRKKRRRRRRRRGGRGGEPAGQEMAGDGEAEGGEPEPLPRREPAPPPESAIEAMEVSRESAVMVLEHDPDEPHATAAEEAVEAGLPGGPVEPEEEGEGPEAEGGEGQAEGAPRRRRRRGGRRHRRRRGAGEGQEGGGGNTEKPREQPREQERKPSARPGPGLGPGESNTGSKGYERG